MKYQLLKINIAIVLTIILSFSPMIGQAQIDSQSNRNRVDTVRSPAPVIVNGVSNNTTSVVAPTDTSSSQVPGSVGGTAIPPGAVGGTGGIPSQSSGNTTANPVTPLKNPLKGINSISDLIYTFMDIVSWLAVILGVIMLIWVGLQFVLAQGNPEEIKKRSNQLLWVIIGIGVILGARILVSVIINTLEATGAVNPAIIQSTQNVINRQ